MHLKRIVKSLALMALFGFSAAQTNLKALFTGAELAVLEQLVTTAVLHDVNVVRAKLALEQTAGELELTGRLKDALTVNAGLSLEGDIYGQAMPNYSINISLDVLKLLPDSSANKVLEAELEATLADTRVRTVQAFIDYKIALENADRVALELESAGALFKAVTARLEVGEATRSDQLRAQTVVSSAAVALLEANGRVIVTLESLAAIVGISPADLIEQTRGR
ncbi:MAG: TolC family protein [Trueperaceae bacterium]|nr:TolC family protein [Trueperaceae bacterium]